ncbi:MAG: helix-turn-helix domain-containing protein [Desulfobacterales bacterium]|jgi:excisionase family DNA binding protein
MEHLVSKATKAAIKHAKYRKSAKVNKDDLLVGILQVISRFDIVQIGQLTIDLEDFEEISRDGFKEDPGNSSSQKVKYSSSANALFEKAACIARKDNSPKVELVHFLVAFADENSGLMVQLKEKYGFSGREWRVALSDWQFFSSEKTLMDSKIAAGAKSMVDVSEKQFFSPDEAAEFLGVHVQTIRGYIRTGKLSALRLAGERALRIKREDLLALLEPFKPEET